MTRGRSDFDRPRESALDDEIMGGFCRPRPVHFGRATDACRFREGPAPAHPIFRQPA